MGKEKGDEREEEDRKKRKKRKKRVGERKRKEKHDKPRDRFHISLDNDEERISAMKDISVIAQTTANQNMKKG